MRRSAISEEETGGEAVKLIAEPFTVSEVDQIDDVRFASGHASRAETIRFLIKRGLEAVTIAAKKPGASS